MYRLILKPLMCHDPQVAPLLTLKENDSLALSSQPMNIPELDSTESVIPVESLAFFWGEEGWEEEET